jgi:RNA-directed DNA polymerase
MTPTTTLFQELCSVHHLFLAWKYLNKTNEASFGLSGESLGDFGINIDANIEILSQQLKSGNFRFSPTRPYLILKDNGKFRPLQIPEVRDRLVLKAIALLLDRELKVLLSVGAGVSFAYQKHLGIKDALTKVKKLYDEGNPFIYEADIIDFFGTVNRDTLLQHVFAKLPDSSLNKLIHNAISQKVGGLDQIEEQNRYLFDDKGGIPQGNALSPLFSNIYLSPFDQKMKDLGHHLVRYADDFVVMSPSFENATKAYNESSAFLKEELGLQVHPLSGDETSKTRIVDPKKELFSFLSVSFDGLHLYPSEKSKDKFLKNILSLCGSNDKLNVISLLTKIRNSHDGWISTYVFTDVTRYFEEIDCLIDAGIYKYLRICGWKFQKTTLGKLPKKYRKIGRKYFQSGECLSVEQRKSSGILLSEDIYKARTAKLTKPVVPKKQMTKHAAKQ